MFVFPCIILHGNDSPVLGTLFFFLIWNILAVLSCDVVISCASNERSRCTEVYVLAGLGLCLLYY